MVKESDWLYYMLLPISTITLLHHYNINMFTTLLLSQHGVGMVGAWVSTVSMFEPKKKAASLRFFADGSEFPEAALIC